MNNNKLRIKLLCSWCPSNELVNIWKKHLKSTNNIELINSNDDNNIDYYVIINGTYEQFVPKKTIWFPMEPNMEINIQRWNAWSNISNYVPSIKCYPHSEHKNLTEWHLSKTAEELMKYSPEKTKSMSIILSDKYMDPGQKLRLDFYNFMKNKGLLIDCYGKNEFKENIKTLPDYNKDEGLFPYKYTFNAENHNIPNYHTEKITDAILSETLCFYYGNESIKKYIDEKAFIFLELKDFEKDYQTVKNAIDNDEWSKRIEFIRKEKEKILLNGTLFDQIEKVLKN